MTKRILTQAKIKEFLIYNQDTGIITNRVTRNNLAIAGNVSGYTDFYGYIVIRRSGRLYKAHQLAWLYVHGVWPKDELDHINGVRNDNRISNLREVTHQENSRNQRLRSTNTSGTCGVSFNNAKNKWQSSITVSGKTIYLGRFENINDAIESRKAADIKYGFHKNHGK